VLLCKMRPDSGLRKRVDYGRRQESCLHRPEYFNDLLGLLGEIRRGSDPCDVRFHGAEDPQVAGLDLVT
jgi:hypothetical protein